MSRQNAGLVKNLCAYLVKVGAQILPYGDKSGSAWVASLIMHNNPRELGECPTTNEIVQAYQAKLN